MMAGNKLGVRFTGIPDEKEDKLKSDVDAPKGPKESMVLTDTSLQLLSREVGNITKLCMYLNMPHARIISMKIDNDDKGKTEKDLACHYLLAWKKMREGSKDKDKVRDMERALRELNKNELADVLVDRHANNLELTPDAFP